MKNLIHVTATIVISLLTSTAFANEEVMADLYMCRGLERQSLQAVQELKLQMQEDLRQYENLKQIFTLETSALYKKSFDPQGSEKNLIDATLYQELNSSIERARGRLDLLNQLCPGDALNATAAIKSFISSAEDQINALRSKAI
jgi:hypothetical protein